MARKVCRKCGPEGRVYRNGDSLNQNFRLVGKEPDDDDDDDNDNITTVDQSKIESVHLAQFRGNCSYARRFSDFIADDCVVVRPTYDATNNLMNSHLQKLHQSKILCDLDVKVGDKVYSIHKLALTSQSEKYLLIFGDPATSVSEICLEGVAPAAVEQVLDYLYTSDIDIREDTAGDIINICDQLDLKVLKEKCFNFLSKFDEKNVFIFLQLSRYHKLENLASKMHDFIAERINTIHLWPQFGFLDVMDVCAILSSDTVHRRSNSEKRLLKIGVKWLKSCEPSDVHRSFAAEVLECIALDKVHPKEIYKQVNAVPFILSDSKCVTILRKAFRHHAYLTRNNMKNSFGRNGTQNDVVQNPLMNDGSQAIIVTGGVGDTKESLEASKEVLKLSISSSKWTKLPSLLTRRSGHGAAFVNGHLFVIGGYIHLTSLLVPKPTEIVDCYNDTLACWHGVASMSVNRALFALATTEDGHIYVFGGETEGFRPTESCECYSMKSDQWTTIVPLSIGRIGASACQHNGVIYVIGGLIEETILPLAECYDLCLKRLIKVDDH